MSRLVPVRSRVEDYADEVRRDFTLVGTKDPEARNIFLRGLRDDIYNEAVLHKPMTIGEAERCAYEAEALLQVLRPSSDVLDTPIAAASPDTTATPPWVSDMLASLDKLGDTIVNMMRTMIINEVSPSAEANYATRDVRRPFNRQPATDRTTDGRPRCRYCHEIGHYTNTCYALDRNRRQQTYDSTDQPRYSRDQ